MPDGKALQSGTSHDLGQNFAKAYGIKFVDADGSIKHAYTTSWGVSWRMLGALIMVHGDDRGLRIPPKMAPIEAIVIPIVRSNDDRAIEASTSLASRLSEAGFRVRVDTRDAQPGWKYSEWDLRGVPVRIEIGPRDVDAETAVLARRDRHKQEPGQRRSVAQAQVPEVLRELHSVPFLWAGRAESDPAPESGSFRPRKGQLPAAEDSDTGPRHRSSSPETSDRAKV